ncbi:BtpA/SgcQ family protein [Pyrococcus yayanosii]|uniref:BtpA/SgcQ family protein n=1 Tax=Pyrococcus yayanosii TaxID=1008460 RepID=UPI00064E668B|nr:BtpA/SgcQ family protein [Pyrococcus yayanosii]
MDFSKKPLIGMVHLEPLPGSYRYGGDLETVLENALKDARTLEEAGFDALIVENFGDAPYPSKAEPPTVAAMAVIARAIAEEVSIPVGVNVLRNDAVAAYSIAYAARADFIRVNVLSGVAFTDQGIIEGVAWELARLRKLLPSKIAVFADVHVKHAVHFGDFASALLDTVERGGADAIIVTGRRTGEPVDVGRLRLAKRISPVPVLVGSGVTPDNLGKLWRHADGFIVGTWIKEGGRVRAEKARRLLEATKRLRATPWRA